MKNKKVIFSDWGLIDYKKAWERQESIFADTVKLKLQIRESLANESAGPPKKEIITPNFLVFCEHPNVYTLGKSGKPEHLLLDEQGLKDKHADFFPIDRGGDITFHGPGQLVCYPLLDLDNFFTDIHLYLRKLEEAVILTLADCGLTAGRYPGYTGVWFDAETEHARKICALGVRCSRWVTMHGLAFNINTDLDYFKNIVPCGIGDKDVTSMQKELGHEVDINSVKEILKHHISVLFDMELVK